MKPSQFILVTLALTLAFAVAAPSQTATPDAFNAEKTTVLGNELFTKSSSTGMVLVAVHGRDVYIHGFGEAAPGTGQPPAANSILRLCSLSKIFATDLLNKLVADHTLRLDDPIQLFAPAHVTVPSRPGHPITLLDLATHTSGLPREVGKAPHGTAHFTFPGYAYRWHWLPAQHLKTAPGTAALYSNIGFDFLGDSLQAAVHEPYAKLLAERTTTPLGMRETGFTPTAEQCSRLLIGFHDKGPCTDTQNSVASAGVYSTGADMAIWLKYLLGLGPVAQDPAAQAVYIQPETLASQSGLEHAGDPTGIGLGWLHILPADSPSHIIEKTGGGGGFTTYIALNHATQTGIFIAFTDGQKNNHFNVFKEANNLLLQMAGLPALPPEPPKPSVKPAHAKARHRRSR